MDPMLSGHDGKEGGKAARCAYLSPELLLDATDGAPLVAVTSPSPLGELVGSVRGEFPEIGVVMAATTGAVLHERPSWLRLYV